MKMNWTWLIEILIPILMKLLEELNRDKTNGNEKLSKQVASLKRKLEKHIA